MRGRRGFSRGPRQLTSWIRLSDVTTTVAASAAVLLTTLGGQTINNTILRTRGRFSVAPNAVDGNIQGAFGCVVVSDPAVAAGVASIPTPITEEDDEGWFVYEPFTYQSRSVELVSMAYDFDSRAQRRLIEGFSVAIVVENNTANSFDFTVSASFLTRLS